MFIYYVLYDDNALKKQEFGKSGLIIVGRSS